MSSSADRAPRYPVDDHAEQRRFFHHLEYGAINGYEYRSDRVREADHPDGWAPEPPDGWQLNVDRWPQYDEERAGWTRVAPGILRNPTSVLGPMLVAYWRRKP